MTIDASRLTIDLETGERWRRMMKVTVPADIVRAEREQAMRKLAGRLKLKGFRKGHVPLDVVERRYGEAVRHETLDKIIGEAYREALRIESLRPISEGEIEEIQFEPDDDLVFRIAFDVSPEIEIGRLGGFKIERPAARVANGELERVLESIREQQGVWKPVEEGPAEEGDLVSVEIQRLEDGEPSGDSQSYDLVIGSGDAIPDVEAAIVTLAPGEDGRFHVRFPDDFPDAARRGEEQHLSIRLSSRRVRELPELDDDLARSVGDFENLDALKAKITEDLQKEAEAQAEAVVRSRIADAITDANRFEVPVSMVDRYVEGILGSPEGVPEEKLKEARDSLAPEAERSLKRILLIDRIAETQGLRSTEDEIDERIGEIAERNNTSPSQVYARLQKSGQLESLEREITERKVFDFLKEQSEIVDA